jgi:hypothetical protein
MIVRATVAVPWPVLHTIDLIRSCCHTPTHGAQAECYARHGDRSKARAGIDWAMDSAELRLKELDPGGMSIDALGIHLREERRHAEAAVAFERTIPLCEQMSDANRGSRLATTYSRILSEHVASDAPIATIIRCAELAVEAAERNGAPAEELELHRGNLERMRATPA